jgi:MFS family permease
MKNNIAISASMPYIYKVCQDIALMRCVDEKYHMNRQDNFADYIFHLPNFFTALITPLYFMTIVPMLLEISMDTGFSPENLNLIVTFFMIGIILGQLTASVYNRSLKRPHIIYAGYVLVIVLLLALGFVKDLYVFYGLYFLMGYFAGVLWLQATGYVLESKIKNKGRLTTIFLTFYPLGNFIAPFIAANLISNHLSWRYYYYIVAAFAVLILFLYALLNKHSKEDPTQIEKVERISLKEIFIHRKINIIFLLGCLLLFFYCISETIIATWSPIFLRQARSFAIDQASLAISIFYIAIIAGRMFVSIITGKVKTQYIILILSILSMVSMFLLVFLKTPFAIFISMTFVGLGCSGIITLGISSTSTLYKKGRGILASIVFAFVNLGTSIAPFITKSVSGFNFTLSVAMAAIFMFFTFILILSMIFYTRDRSS